MNPFDFISRLERFFLRSSHIFLRKGGKFLIAKKENLPSVTCWGTGKVYREFMHVDDLASAIIFCLEYWCPNDLSAPLEDNGDPLTYLNVGTGSDISIKDLALLIAEISGFNGKILWDTNKPDGTPKKLLNSNKIKKKFPKNSFIFRYKKIKYNECDGRGFERRLLKGISSKDSKIY